MKYSALVNVTGEDRANLFAQEILKTIVGSSGVTNITKPNGLTDLDAAMEKIEQAIDYVNPKSRAEIAAERSDGPANKVFDWLYSVKHTLEALEEAEQADTPEKKAKAFDKAMDNLSYCARFRGDITQDLHDYFEKYGYTEFNKKPVSFIGALGQAVDNAGAMMRSEDRKVMVEECLQAEEDMNNRQTQFEDKCRDFYTECYTKTGLIPTMDSLGTAEFRLKQKAKDAANYYVKLRDSRRSIRDDHDSAERNLYFIDKKIDALGIDPLEERLEKLNSLAKKLEEADKSELVGREQIIEADKELLGTEHDNVDNVDERIKIAEGRVAQRDGAQKNIALLLGNKDNKALIDEYTELMPRQKALAAAWNDMNAVKNSGVDIGKLLKTYNEDPESPELNEETKDLVTRYINAREDIITNLHNSSENRQITRDIYTRLEEAGGNIPVLFEAEYGSKFMQSFQDMTDRVEELEAEKTIRDFMEYAEIIQDTGDCEDILKEAKEQKEGVMERAKRIKSDYEKQNEILAEYTREFCESTGVACEEGKHFTFKGMQEFLAAEKEKVQQDISDIKKSFEYRDLMKERNEWQTKFDKTAPENVKKEMKEAKEEAQLYKERYEYLQTFNEKWMGLQKEGNLLREENAKLQAEYQEKFQMTSNVSLISNHLAKLSMRLADKSTRTDHREDSTQFTILSDMLDSTFNGFIQKNVNTKERARRLQELGTAAKSYLDAKNKQWRPWPFASEKRFARLSAARNILNFCNEVAPDGTLQPGAANKLMANIAPKEVQAGKYAFGNNLIGYEVAMTRLTFENKERRIKPGDIDKSIAAEKQAKQAKAKPEAGLV